MSLISDRDEVSNGYEPVELPSDPVIRTRPTVTMFRRRAARPSRRAVLHVQVTNDPPVPSDLVSWYTERGFHFYVAGLRWTPRSGLRGRRPARSMAATFADLDDACAHLRRVDGIDTVIVSAHGTGAQAAALWCDARRDGVAADALLLYASVFGRQFRRGLDISCPVLVLSGGGEKPEQVRGRHRAGIRRGPGNTRLGPHVTLLRLPDAEAGPEARDRRRFFDEMGRWLGAYMYGQVRDQLL